MCFRRKIKFKKTLTVPLCDPGVYALVHHQKQMQFPRHQKKMLWPVSLSYLEVLQELLHFTTSTITVLQLYFYISLYPIKKSIFRFAFCLFRPSSIGLSTEYRVIIKFSEGIYFPVCKIGWGGRQGLTTTATGLNKMAIHQYASRNR